MAQNYFPRMKNTPIYTILLRGTERIFKANYIFTYSYEGHTSILHEAVHLTITNLAEMISMEKDRQHG